jgi:protein arginine N-methyltransferase 1
VPERVELLVAPIEDPEVRGRIEFWSRPVCGLDFSPVHRWAANTGYPRHLEPTQVLGSTASIAVVDLPPDAPAPLTGRATLAVERGGTLDGIGGWFSATLAPGVSLTNAPGAARRLHRRNVVLPVTPVTVQPGDSIELTLQVLPADLVVAWRGMVVRAKDRVAFSGSTLSGMLLTPDDLRRLRPDSAPRLTARGRARLSVLELCDGERPLREIEREVLTRHPSLFASSEQVAVFVAEVVSRYAQ